MSMSRRQARADAANHPGATLAQSPHLQDSSFTASREAGDTSFSEGRGLTRAAAVLRSKLHGRSQGDAPHRAEPANIPALNLSSRRHGNAHDYNGGAAQASPMPGSSLSPAMEQAQDDDQYFRCVW